MIVKVTQEHIDKALKEIETAEYLCTTCPIAQALKDTFKTKEAYASYEYLRVGQFPENLIFEVKTPDEVSEWMENFDLNNNVYVKEEEFTSSVKPFEFELSLEGVKL